MRNRVITVWLLLGTAAVAQQTYQKPPREILDILNAPTTPELSLSPDRQYAILRHSRTYPPISEVAEPMLRLAGLRINPKTNGLMASSIRSRWIWFASPAARRRRSPCRPERACIRSNGAPTASSSRF